MNPAPTLNNTANRIQRLARLVDSRELEIILLPTEKCNFRCTYCYEDFTVGKMKTETINAVKGLMRRRASELDRLFLSWFGGEPLLAKDVVTELSGYAAELAREQPSLSYLGQMTTNGYFLDEPTFSALTKVGVLAYQISLDGPREVHDRTRVQSGGGRSFDTIWNNLLSIRASSIPAQVTLRVHFSADTLPTVEPLIEEIRGTFLSDSRFTVFLKSVGRLGGANDLNIQLLTPAEEQAALRDLKRKLYGDDYRQPEEGHVCYASRPNSLVIRADGRIGKCTVALNDSRNVIGALRPDGTLALDQKRVRPWLRGLRDMNADTLACPLVGLPPE